ncbi:hypothetical protein [Paenibacillus ihuae]|uniref:hypothetical protein n=1 Tax=Paenibacillus ihuae TaxID=1232431 RepID=UPI0006D546E7|nr:hypothetical protein [Paenibacillus ihuae]
MVLPGQLLLNAVLAAASRNIPDYIEFVLYDIKMGGYNPLEEVSQENEQNENERIDLISWLGSIKRDFDPLLLEARKQYPINGWVGSWLIRSLTGFKYIKMPENSVSKIVTFFSNHITIWASIAIGAFGAGANKYLPLFSHLQPWPRTIGVFLMVVSLAMSLKANFTRMLTLDDPYFNPNAYKLFRPKEYFMFLNYFKGHYDFETVFKTVELLYRENSLDSILQVHESINNELRADKQKIIESLEENRVYLEDAEKVIAELNTQIWSLADQVTINEQNLNAAIDVLYRLRKGASLFNPADLRVVTPFSLFELKGNYLFRHFEQGTTETPSVIRIDDSKYAHYSSVKLVNSDKTIEYATSDREGRTVASYWIELPSERILIYNFHYDSTNSGMSAIIESKEMYRFIRGICIHLEERHFFEKKEDVRDA